MVRKMNAADVPRAGDVLADAHRFIAGPDRFSPLELAALLEKCATPGAVRTMMAERRCFVALKDDLIVGVLTVNADQIADLFVDPAFHRQGFGRELFAAAVRVVHEAGHGRLWLVTTGYGIPFYRAMGMEVTGPVPVTSGPLLGRTITRLEMPLR